jgi:hypothetical protein
VGFDNAMIMMSRIARALQSEYRCITGKSLNEQTNISRMFQNIAFFRIDGISCKEKGFSKSSQVRRRLQRMRS